jgi:hypothetical protein
MNTCDGCVNEDALNFMFVQISIVDLRFRLSLTLTIKWVNFLDLFFVVGTS